MRLILASTSPRRRELLDLLGLAFDVAAPSFVEQVRPDIAAEEQAKQFAVSKAVSCAEALPDDVVLGSDTLISLGSEVLGKPADREDAAAMLRRMSGRTHLIYTAVSLVCPAAGVSDVELEIVRVTMKPFGDSELVAYIRTGESLGKAGAYSIQGLGGSLIEKIEGDYTAAVGLPLRLVAAMLRRRGIRCPVDVEDLYRKHPYPNWSNFSDCEAC
jgi:septum formation protein